MLTIPPISRNFGPWEFKCIGLGPKAIKSIVEEVSKTVLVHERIKKQDICLELFLKDEPEMAELNKKLMKKEGPCDTISLPIDNQTLQIRDCPTLLGTIFLCWPVIKEDAASLKRNELAHLAHIVVHSMLHLLGYEHETPELAKSMESKEINILSKLGVPSPYKL